MKARLSKPTRTADGWTINVRSVNGHEATLGPFPTKVRALEAQYDWHSIHMHGLNRQTNK